MRLLSTGLLLLCTCFSPEQRDGVIACGQDDICPPGYVCAADRKCWRNPPPEIDAGPLPECSDGIDNDCDGLIDYAPGGGGDPGCDSPDDPSERGTVECDDGIDNDGDGKADFHVPGCGTGDSKCSSPIDDDESH
jgi:hypothetical protein